MPLLCQMTLTLGRSDPFVCGLCILATMPKYLAQPLRRIGGFAVHCKLFRRAAHNLLVDLQET